MEDFDEAKNAFEEARKATEEMFDQEWTKQTENRTIPTVEQPKEHNKQTGKRKLLWYRIKLMFSYIKLVICVVLFFLWLFSPLLLVMFLPESAFVLGWLCIIAFYFNFKLIGNNDFLLNKWFKAIETEQRELRYAILEEKGLITEVGNIKILPFGKH